MVIDGKGIASDLLVGIREGVLQLGRNPIVGVLSIEASPVTESYLRIKHAKAVEAGMILDIIRMESDATTEAFLHKIGIYDKDALIVQLPLPEHLDRSAILDAIPAARDADVLSSAARARFTADEPGALLPPVVAAISEVLMRAGTKLEGKRAVVIGNGQLVGRPAASWLEAQGAIVTVLDKDTFSAKSGMLAEAEIIVSGAGSPHLITPDLISAGAVLIDAGTSESGGAIVGDFDPACAELASVFTPVPGGIGPIAVAHLFANVLKLVRATEQ
jgi:methylenetetrahydrofolate dehydrogenase (NADP+)/methenyltetrahydrofolate cyclohydrolase